MPDAEKDAGRDAILDAAIKRHDLLYGNGHCDRKYILSCRRLPEIILSLPLPVPNSALPPAATIRRVHDHQPYRPVCNERDVDGQLRGACLNDDGTRVTSPEHGERLEPPKALCPACREAGEGACWTRVLPPGEGRG